MQQANSMYLGSGAMGIAIAICCRAPGGVCFGETKGKKENETTNNRPRMANALELTTKKENHNSLVPLVGNLAI